MNVSLRRAQTYQHLLPTISRSAPRRRCKRRMAQGMALVPSAPLNQTDYDLSNIFQQPVWDSTNQRFSAVDPTSYSNSMSPAEQLSSQISPTNATANYPNTNASAFSTLMNPLDGSPMPGAPEEWNTEALPPSIEQRMLCVCFPIYPSPPSFCGRD